MAKIKISYTAPGADVVTGKIDGTKVSFSGTAKAGSATVTVAAGQHHLTYTVEGLPDTSYTFKIEDSTPPVSLTDTIGETGFAAGSIPFTVSSMAVSAAKKPAKKAAKKAAKKPAKKAAKKPAKKATKKGGGK